MVRQYVFRHTLLLLLFPSRFIDTGLDEFDFKAWFSEEYEWEQDPLWGLLDHAQPVEDTIDRNRGDCVDIGLVAASWLASRDQPVYFGVSFRGPGKLQFPRHFVASDGQRVFDNRAIWPSITEYLEERPRYDNLFLWRVR